MKFEHDIPRALAALRKIASTAKHDSICDPETVASFEGMRHEDQVEFLLRMITVMVFHMNFLEEKIDTLMDFASEQIIEKNKTGLN